MFYIFIYYFHFSLFFFFFFFFNDTATTEIYTLSLHDALPTCCPCCGSEPRRPRTRGTCPDRKSTRLNSSHITISYAVFCLKKKKKKNNTLIRKKQKINKKTKQHKKQKI